MKNICKKLLTVVTCLSLAICLSVPVFAAETPESVKNDVAVSSTNDISTFSNNYSPSGVIVTSSWTRVASSTTGFNCNVKISSLGTGLGMVDVRLLGKNGNVVWSQYEAFGSLSYGVFWCGPDVYQIQVKYHSSGKRGTILTYPA